VRFDPRRLSRVFFNLAYNATDAMPNGGTIVLRFHSDANAIITEIEDTGPGIAPEIADKLFQPFATYGKSHGTALGLSICKKIVEVTVGKCPLVVNAAAVRFFVSHCRWRDNRCPLTNRTTPYRVGMRL
jgi:C4-dicarboxylate-specific signal transduction histidine kinase